MKTKSIAMLLCLLLAACSTDQPIEAAQEARIAEIAGTYRLTEMISAQPSTFNKGSSSPYNVIRELPCLEVFRVLQTDMQVTGSATEMQYRTDPAEGWLLSCGERKELPATNWSLSVNTVIIGGERYQLTGDQLVVARDPATNDFYKLVFTRER